MPRLSNKKVKAVVAGFLGSLGLVLFYFLITVLVTSSLQFPVNQFRTYKFLMTPLVLGFGIQVGLWQYLRLKRVKTTGVGVVAGAGISGGTMVACCVHHLTDILPILGFSALSVVLVKYQVWLLVLGVLTNIVGIALMVRRIREARC